MNRGAAAWRRLPLGARAALALAAAAFAVQVAARAVETAAGGADPRGPRSSSYATAPQGLAAYAELLRRFDHDVDRRRGSLTGGPLDPGATVVALDPGAIDDAERDALLHFVTSGGRLVVGGASAAVLGLRDDPPAWHFEGPSAWTVDDPSLAGVERIETAGSAWSDPGSGERVVTNERWTLLTAERAGAGEILFLADPAVLHNARLGDADNAAFGLALAGEGRPVVFAEGVHGFGTEQGWRAIPDRWKFTLGGLALAALVFVAARGRRLGPPEAAGRTLPPPRRAYVDAVAATLARTRRPAEALAPLREAARRRLAARAGLPPDAPAPELRAAARAAGLEDEEIEAVVDGAGGDAGALAAARACARLERAARVTGGDAEHGEPRQWEERA